VLSTVELREGGEHGHEEEGHAEDEHAEDEHASGDPHVWLDPVRLATIATAVADRLAEVDPDAAGDYRARAEELEDELTALDDELRTGLASCERREVVTSHDAFGYLADAYGLEQVAIAGLSPEDEASPRRLAEVAAQAEAAGVTTIFFEESVSPKVAESLAREVGATATVLSPLELAPESGNYLAAMRDNLARLRTALDCA
jgi:zinc transport system substrate-binding protein